MRRGNKITWKAVRRDRYLIYMLIPVVIFFLLFSYLPMYGVIIAFKDYSVGKGITGSPFVGLKYFRQFFEGFYFSRLLSNTLLISVYNLLWGFPIPIIFALILNEFRDSFFKRAIQTVSYLPHFISMVVICGMIVNFLSPQNGVVNLVLQRITGKTINFLGDPRYFRSVYIASGVWQEFGWNSIIYLAALSGIDPQLYEAAKIDGANKRRQLWHITLPGIKGTIITLLLLSLGNVMSVGFEKIILLYNPSTYETADVISTYVYRMGLKNSQYSFSAAVGLFNSVINVVLLVSCNYISKKATDVGIW